MQIKHMPGTKTALKVLVIGYYGHLNAGDDLLQQALAYVFQDHKLMFSSWQPSVHLLNECDLVVVGGGSIWPGFSFFQVADDYARALKVPLMVLGISSKQPNPEVLKKTCALIDKALLFHVRDEATFCEFGSPDSVRSGVDLFWWMPWSGCKAQKHDDAPLAIAVNLREWDAEWSPDDVMHAIRNCCENVLPLPLYFGSPKHDANIKLNDVQLLHSVGFSQVGDHWSEEPLVNADICVSMRYHAILMSVRMHIPVIGFDFHPKMVSFFQENDIPELCVPLKDTDQLRQAIENVAANLEEYSAKFRSISKKLEAAGARDLANCHRLLTEVKPRPRPGLLRRGVMKILQYVQ